MRINLEGKKLPILASLALAFCIFILLFFQGKSGNNEVFFAYRSESFNDAVRQYLIERRSFLEKEGYFPHDAYYFDEILKLLKPGLKELKGDEKGIIAARITVLENLKPLVVEYEKNLRADAEKDFARLAQTLDSGEIAQKRMSLGNLLQSHLELEGFEKSLNGFYASAMDENEVEGWKIERELGYTGLSFLGELRNHWRKIMLAKRQNFNVQLAMISILEEDWGLWSLDPETEEIVFAKETANTREFTNLENQWIELQKREKALFTELRFYY